MREYQKQLDKLKTERDTLEALSKRVLNRIGELGVHIRALEALDRVASQETHIPQEVVDYLETLPEPTANGDAVITQSGNGSRSFSNAHIIFRLFYENRRKELTSSDVLEQLQGHGHDIPREDVDKILDRQARSGRLSKRGSEYSLSRKGIHYIEKMRLNV